VSSLTNIKEGDFVTCVYGTRIQWIKRVLRTTRTRILTVSSGGSEVVWRRKDGKLLRGTGSWGTRIECTTTEHRQVLKAESLRYKIREALTNRLESKTCEQLEDIYNLMR